MSRTVTNEDILNNLLISSDPRISTLRSHLSPFQNSMANVLFPDAQILLFIANTPTEDEPDPQYLDVWESFENMETQDPVMDYFEDNEFLEDANNTHMVDVV